MPANPFQSGLSVQVSGDASGANRALQSVMGNLTSMKGLALVAGGAIAAAIGVKSVNAARQFQDAMNESLAIMGDVSETMRKDMSQAARDVATSTRFSAEEAAESYFFLASAGLDAKESIAALPQVAQFAQAGMFDMATATDLLTDAQSALGKTMEDPEENMEEMAELSDILVKANTLANASVEQFSEALTNKAAPAMRNNNISTEEGVAVLAAFADAGLKGRRAGTILARTIQGLQKRATENADAFEDYGISVFDANGEMRSFADISGDLTAAFEDMSPKARAAAFEQLGFNRRTRRGVNLLIDQEDALREYRRGLEDAGGTTEEVANKQMQSFNAQLDILKSQLNDVGITIGNALLPFLTDLVKGFSNLITETQEAGAAVVEWGETTRDQLRKTLSERGLEANERGWVQIQREARGAKTAAEEYAESVINSTPDAIRRLQQVRDRTKEVGDAAQDAGDDAEEGMERGESAARSFIDTLSELRRGAVSGLSVGNVRRLVEEELPELMEQAEQPGGLTDERQVNFAIALQEAQQLIEAGELDRITDLPKDTATALAREIAQRQKEEQTFRQDIFERLQDLPFFKNPPSPEVSVETQTNVTVEFVGDLQAFEELFEINTLTEKEERTARFLAGA